MKLLFGVIMILCAAYGVLNVRNGMYRRARMPLAVVVAIFLAAIILRLLTRH